MEKSQRLKRLKEITRDGKSYSLTINLNIVVENIQMSKKVELI